MYFYAGMAEAAVSRLYGLRWEYRNTARAGVHARDSFPYVRWHLIHNWPMRTSASDYTTTTWIRCLPWHAL